MYNKFEQACIFLGEFMKITVLGSSHGDPTVNANTTSVLLQTGNKNYLIDAGEHCSRALMLNGITPSFINAVIITHMHIDHTAGLPHLLHQARKYRWDAPELVPVCLLPDAAALAGLKAWNDVNGARFTADGTLYKHYRSGEAFNDGNIVITAYPTDHLKHITNREANSFALKVQTGNKTVFFSGDVSDVAHDFSDFPVEAANGCDLLFAEITHFDPVKALEVWKKLQVGKMVFYHIGNPWQTPEGQAEILEMCKVLPYEVEFCCDNKQYSL